MCPCNQNDGNFAIALLAAAAIVMAVSVLRGHWPTMKTGSRILSVVAIALVACLGLAFGSRGSRNGVCPVPPPPNTALTAPAMDPPAASAPAAMPVSRPVATALAEEQSQKVIAYYFHRTIRCHTCLTIEELSKQAIEGGFAAELAGELVEWRPVNIEEKSNEHFEKDYDLAAQSLVLVRLENGRQANWKNLSAVWDLVGDSIGFEKYVRTELRTFLYGDIAGQQ